jgi:hypothetical protein
MNMYISNELNVLSRWETVQHHGAGKPLIADAMDSEGEFKN